MASDGVDTILLPEPKKLGVILALTRELHKKPAARAVTDALLRESAAKSIDAAYFSADAAVRRRSCRAVVGRDGPWRWDAFVEIWRARRALCRFRFNVGVVHHVCRTAGAGRSSPAGRCAECCRQ